MKQIHSLARRRLLWTLSVVLLPGSIMAGNMPTDPDARKRCDIAREKLVAPERDRLIKKCIKEKKEPAYCEEYYRDYGMGGMVGGRYRRPLYHDIPECREAVDEAKRNRATDRGIILGRDADNVNLRDSDVPVSDR